ncbi:hypothetical protein BH739_01270 [Enterococcus casseliflavus]|nr:hypothetical protein BH739_01270 [Enterococcus casseliflavus]
MKYKIILISTLCMLLFSYRSQTVSADKIESGAVVTFYNSDSIRDPDGSVPSFPIEKNNDLPKTGDKKQPLFIFLGIVIIGGVISFKKEQKFK